MTSSPDASPPGPSAACPEAETLAALALGEGEPEARRDLADHVIGCPACTADFRLLRELHRTARIVEGRRWKLRPSAAAAAVVLAAVAIGLWLRQGSPIVVAPDEPTGAQTSTDDATARLAEAQRRLAERESELAAIRRELESARSPAVNVPIVDLEPGRARGATDAEAELQVPPGASWMTVVLAVSGGASADEHTLEIRDEAGRTVWRGGGLVRSRFGTFTIAIPARLLPAGRYQFLLSRPARDGAPRVVQEYRLAVAPPGP